MTNNLFAASFKTILWWLALMQLLLILLGMWFVLKPILDSSTDILARQLIHQWQQAESGSNLQAHPKSQQQSSYLLFNRWLQYKLQQRLAPRKVKIYSVAHEPGLYFVAITEGAKTTLLQYDSERIGTRPALTIMLSLLFFLLSTLIVAWHLARRQRKVYAELGQQALRIGQGQFQFETPNFDIVEIQQLFFRLQQMSQQLALAETEKSTLLAGISHDIRTPITRLNLLLELHEHQLDEQFKHQVSDELHQMAQLLEAFQEHARQRVEEVQQNQEQTDLADWLEHWLQAYHEPRLQWRTEPCVIALNRLVLQRVLQNLIDNALKYTEGEVFIELQQSPETVQLQVCDQGRGGADAKQLEALAEAFKQGQNSQGGSGLGLYVVRYLCRDQHWQLNFATPSRGGLCVSILLEKP